MGDRPTPIENEHDCGNMFWDDGMQPDFISCALTGWGKGNDWEYMEPPLPNGRYELAWQECGHWVYEDSAIQIVGSIYQGAFLVGILDRIGGGQWTSLRALADPHHPNFSFIGEFYTWTIGDSSLTLFSSGAHRPPSWDGADLLGIPENQDYFAEEKTPTQENRYNRYSSHGSKSVLHMIGNY